VYSAMNVARASKVIRTICGLWDGLKKPSLITRRLGFSSNMFAMEYEYWLIYLGKNWMADPRIGEVIGIVRVPYNYGSWEIYHKTRPDPVLGSWAKVISQAEYETYETFGFLVYKYGTIRYDDRFDRAAYDPRYWELVADHMVRIKDAE